ncbi:hypothetical protein [Chitinophaga flava]|uniref:Type II secretion system protein n=1 Tax=Chitinophaga flava TaxID=2259036 RepID=A0A365XZE0_9BACT|nr:hypothetical protein [Chitinophaga flava]RBL91717.1 hypothetical protein DF182_03675 [Chitinophaga flava]
MAELIKKRVKAATIVESIVALLIILIAFGIVMRFFAYTIQPSLGLKKEKGRLLLNSKIEAIARAPEIGSFDYDTDDFNIRIEITPYQGNNAILYVAGSVSYQGQLISNKKMLINKPLNR